MIGGDQFDGEIETGCVSRAGQAVAIDDIQPALYQQLGKSLDQRPGDGHSGLCNDNRRVGRREREHKGFRKSRRSAHRAKPDIATKHASMAAISRSRVLPIACAR
jgi:hypothetical protein